MSSCKTVYYIAVQNFRKWRKDYRILISFIILMIFIHEYTKGLSSFCDSVSIKSSPWIFPFLYTGYYTKLLFFFPLLLILSNAPFIDRNQLYVISRSGRIKWCVGQIFYIILTSGAYFIFILLFSVLINIRNMNFTTEWGKVINTLANTNSGLSFNIGFTPDKNVVNMFTPIQAVWFTFLHSWITGIILGLIIFLFNMVIKGSGTFISSFVLVFSAIASKRLSLVKYSPVNWSTLNFIHLTRNDVMPEYSYVVKGYTGILLILILLLIFLSGRYNYDKDFKR